MDEQRKWFLEMKSTPGEDVVKTVEMTMKHLYFYINLVDKEMTRFEGIESNFERSLIFGKIISSNIVWYIEIVQKW